MPVTCVVVNCGSVATRDCVSFYRIPTVTKFQRKVELNELKQRRRDCWLAAIKRDDLTETKIKYQRVCSKHFITGKPAHLLDHDNADWVPSQLMGYDTGPHLKRKSASDRHERVKSHKKRLKLEIEETTDVVSEVETVQVLKETETLVEVQTDIRLTYFKESKDTITNLKKMLKQAQTKLMSFGFLRNNDNRCKYYTGLTWNTFSVILSDIKNYFDTKYNAALPVSISQLVLGLMKLRLNLDFKDLACRFEISPSTASVYFSQIIDVLYERYKSLIKWSDKSVAKNNIPNCFLQVFKNNIRVIIDCFQVFIYPDK